MIEVGTPVDGWPYDAINANWKENKLKWQPVTEEFYYDQLGALPPIQHESGAFMVGECSFHNGNTPYYCGCINVNGKYFAKYSNPLSFKAECNLLRNFLNR